MYAYLTFQFPVVSSLPFDCAKTALTSLHTWFMVFRMKTTLVLPDPVFRALKRCAVERDETVSELATEFLRKGLAARPNRKRLSPLPTFDMGRAKVDVADRDALYEAMEQD